MSRTRFQFTRTIVEQATLELDVNEDVATMIAAGPPYDNRFDAWALWTVLPLIPKTSWQRAGQPKDVEYTIALEPSP